MAATEFEIPSGTLIDQRYRIRRVLGRGGFGRTYLAADERRFNELCVLKEFVPKTNGDSVVDHKLQELFMREASILHKLDHPQIPRFFASFEQNNRLFIAQEYVDGKTYWRVLQDRQRFGLAFTEFEVLQFLRDLLRVLHYVHQQKIVHRDISPDNIMLPKGRDLPVLIDFGVVKQAVTYVHGIAMGADDIIQASVSVGKFGYAPYEQIRMGQCSSRSDLYALGVTAIVLLTGKAPNLLIDPKSLDWNWRSHARVDDRFAAILNQMMADKPQDRYASAMDVLGDLENLGQCIGIRASRVILPATGMLNSVSQPHQATDLLEWPTHVERPANTTLNQSSSTLQQHQTISQTMPRLTGIVPATQIRKPQARNNRRNFERSPLLWAHKPLWQVVSVCGLALLPIGGALVGVRSPYIPALCQPLNNCIDDQDSKGRYEQAVEQADAALISVQTATSVMDLQRAHDLLADAIAQMLTISSDVSVFSQVQQNVQRYQTRYGELETRLAREIRAVDLLSRAETLAQSANEQMKIAKTAADFASVQLQWRKAIATLQAIPDGTFVAPQTAQYTQQYTAQISQLNPKVALGSGGGAPAEPDVNTTVRMIAPGTPQATTSPTNPTATQKSAASRSARPQTSPNTVRRAEPTLFPAQRPSYAQPAAIASVPAVRASSSPRSAFAPLTANAISQSPQRSPVMLSRQTTLPIDAGQTVNDVSIRIEGAQLSSTGTLIANFTVENSSNRVFGFVPLFTEVRDANQQPIRSRMMIGAANAMVPPGGKLEGQMFIFDRSWNITNYQNLRLLISEGTTGSRAFDIVF